MIYAAITIYGLFFILFIVGTVIKNNSIVDIFWGLGFVLSSWVVFLIQGDYHTVKVVGNLMVTFWGVRLFVHIGRRNIGKPEDFRYQNWRKAWGKYVVLRAFLQVYMLQATFMFLIAYAVNYVNLYINTLNYLSLIGVAIFFVGFYFQVEGDYQLKRFLKYNRGLLQTGLWSITRHPNYFGESLMWIGISVFAICNGAPFYVLISPLVITVVLRFISIPILEEKMKQKKGWEEYSEKVSIFIPYIKL